VAVVGLTGGIGAGKTTALSMFSQLGAVTISSDEVVHSLYQKPELRGEVARRFGPDVLDNEGRLDRSRLVEAVRGRGDELRWLEALTHPRVKEEIQRRIEEAPPGAVVVCEVPLLFESRCEDMFDLIVTVEASAENRRRRSVHSFDEALFSELEGLQAASEERMAGSDLVFLNEGDLAGLRAFVAHVYARAQELLREGR